MAYRGSNKNHLIYFFINSYNCGNSKNIFFLFFRAVHKIWVEVQIFSNCCNRYYKEIRIELEQHFPISLLYFCVGALYAYCNELSVLANFALYKNEKRVVRLH